MSDVLSNVLLKMKGPLDKKRHMSQKKLLRQHTRFEYEKQNGSKDKYKSGKKYNKSLTKEQQNKIIMALTIVKDYWFDSYSPVKCKHIALDYKHEKTRNSEIEMYIPKIIIKSSWASYYYNIGVPLILGLIELQEMFDHSNQTKLKDNMIINEMKGVCEAIRIMYKEKCIVNQIIRY